MPPDEKRRGDPTAEVEEAERKPTGRKKMAATKCKLDQIAQEREKQL
jgi:hypothetical protein